jgi:Bacterial regulatory helix-turn-helix protein, lysR family
MLDDINELSTFVSIVEARSLSAAALEMDLALSVVSKRLASLERRAEAQHSASRTDRRRVGTVPDLSQSHVWFGSTTDMTRSNRDVRSTLESRHFSALFRCLLWAISGLMHRNK